MRLNYFDKHRDKGLLILRIGIGIMFMLHGYPKITGGPEKWTILGKALGTLGIDFYPALMGFVAALSEFIGGFLLIIGFFTRPASFFLFSTMVVATIMHVSLGHPFVKYSHALEAAILFFSLIIIGPGDFSIDEKMRE